MAPDKWQPSGKTGPDVREPGRLTSETAEKNLTRRSQELRPEIRDLKSGDFFPESFLRPQALRSRRGPRPVRDRKTRSAVPRSETSLK
jgi:hypothetical protein